MLSLTVLFVLVFVGSADAMEQPMQLSGELTQEIVLYNPVSLFSRCLMLVLKDARPLANQESVKSLISLMREEAKRMITKTGNLLDTSNRCLVSEAVDTPSEEEIETHLLRYLQRLADSTDIPLEGACSLHLLKPKLNRSRNVQRLLQAIARGKYLSQDELTVLAQTFNPEAILKKSFSDLLSSYGSNHPQKGAIAQSFIQEHRQCLIPDFNSIVHPCFRQKVTDAIPPAEETFHDNQLKVIYKKSNLTAEIYKEEKHLFDIPTVPVLYFQMHPATISADGRLFALATSRFIAIYLLPFAKSLVSCPVPLALKLPNKLFFSAITAISFSNDAKWLSFITNEGTAYFYELPSYYLKFKFSLEQIVYIRILQRFEQLQNNNWREFDPLGTLRLEMYYKLSQDTILASFPEVDQKFFKSELDKLLALGRQRRERALSEMAGPFTSILAAYFYPGELVHLEESLVDIKSPRLQKKITKRMFAALTTLFPTHNFSVYKQISKEDKRISIWKNMRLAWQQYRSYQKDKDPQKFKEDFVNLMTGAYEDFKAYA